MDYIYISLFIFFLSSSMIIWYPVRLFDRSETTDIEFAWVAGILFGVAISCLVLQFI